MMKLDRHRTAALMLLVAIGNVSLARADPITSYSYTNLGPNSYLSTDSDGNRVIVASDGQKYAFPGSTPQAWSSDQLAKMDAPMPSLDSNPKNSDYAVYNPYQALSNQNGYFVASIDIFPLYQQGHYTPNEIFSFKQMPNGTFSPLQILYTQYDDFANFGHSAQVLDINKNNLVLASVEYPSYPAANGYLLYDLNTGKSSILPLGLEGPLTNPSAFAGLSLDNALAIDDQGRILYAADRMVNGKLEMDRVLLTPAGLSTEPIPAPEPTTLVTLGIAVIGLLVRRRRGR